MGRLARMLGTWGKPRCPVCRANAGRDCADDARTKRQRRQQEKREWRKEAQEDVRV